LKGRAIKLVLKIDDCPCCAASAVENCGAYGREPRENGGGVITRDLARRERITEGEIKSGSVFINDSVPSRLPSTGVKESGCGRKLSSYGVKEFVNIKTGRGVAANRPAITSRNFTIPRK